MMFTTLISIGSYLASYSALECFKLATVGLGLGVRQKLLAVENFDGFGSLKSICGLSANRFICCAKQPIRCQNAFGQQPAIVFYHESFVATSCTASYIVGHDHT